MPVKYCTAPKAQERHTHNFALGLRLQRLQGLNRRTFASVLNVCIVTKRGKCIAIVNPGSRHQENRLMYRSQVRVPDWVRSTVCTYDPRILGFMTNKNTYERRGDSSISVYLYLVLSVFVRNCEGKDGNIMGRFLNFYLIVEVG
ncbi:hypothetical protein RSAG8_02446, partial [Rhizoctonia solani AG-8 WAC10335]